MNNLIPEHLLRAGNNVMNAVADGDLRLKLDSMIQQYTDRLHRQAPIHVTMVTQGHVELGHHVLGRGVHELQDVVAGYVTFVRVQISVGKLSAFTTVCSSLLPTC